MQRYDFLSTYCLRRQRFRSNKGLWGKRNVSYWSREASTGSRTVVLLYPIPLLTASESSIVVYAILYTTPTKATGQRKKSKSGVTNVGNTARKVWFWHTGIRLAKFSSWEHKRTLTMKSLYHRERTFVFSRWKFKQAGVACTELETYKSFLGTKSASFRKPICYCRKLFLIFSLFRRLLWLFRKTGTKQNRENTKLKNSKTDLIFA